MERFYKIGGLVFATCSLQDFVFETDFPIERAPNKCFKLHDMNNTLNDKTRPFSLPLHASCFQLMFLIGISRNLSTNTTNPPNFSLNKKNKNNHQDVRATDEELEALQAELDSVRRASSMSTAIEAPAAPEPAVAAVAPEMSPMAWRGPPGLVAPASMGDAEQILVLVDEFG